MSFSPVGFAVGGVSIKSKVGDQYWCLSFHCPISMSGHKHLFRSSFDTLVSGSACPFLLPTGDDHATVCTRLITIACDNSSPVCDLMRVQLQKHDAHAHRFGSLVNQVLHSYTVTFMCYGGRCL